MSFLSSWHFTNMPEEIVDILVRDANKYGESNLKDSVIQDDHNQLNKQVRNSKNAWISASNWIGGFVWHYVQSMNRENFRYDLTAIDGECIQYTEYSAGQFYNWHIDAGIERCYNPQITISQENNISEDLKILSGEYIRKLSFVVQLSSHEDYTGGELQLMNPDGTTFFAPKQRGTVIVFDSRTPHRVRKVKSGVRRSLVGWVVGPRWK